MANVATLPLTLAVHDYDHVRDLASGVVGVEGVSLTVLHHPVEEIFFRFTRFREWDVSELSLAKYCSLRAAGERSLVAIPVFTSRAFRHSAIFVRDDGPVDDPAALSGARIGVPEWTQTATVYARGVLAHEFGVALTDVNWVQAGTNEPGRSEGVAVTLPEGVSLTPMPERTLNELLLGGEIDALIAAHPTISSVPAVASCVCSPTTGPWSRTPTGRVACSRSSTSSRCGPSCTSAIRGSR